MAVRNLPPRVSRLERPKTAVRGLAARVRATSRVAKARIGYGAGVLVASWGLGVLFGLGWALLAAGAVCCGSFLLLYPVDGER